MLVVQPLVILGRSAELATDMVATNKMKNKNKLPKFMFLI